LITPIDASAAPALINWVVERWGLTNWPADVLAKLAWQVIERAVNHRLEGEPVEDPFRAARFLLLMEPTWPRLRTDPVPGSGMSYEAACERAGYHLDPGKAVDFTESQQRQVLAAAVSSRHKHRSNFGPGYGGTKWVAAFVYVECDLLLGDNGFRQELLAPYSDTPRHEPAIAPPHALAELSSALDRLDVRPAHYPRDVPEMRPSSLATLLTVSPHEGERGRVSDARGESLYGAPIRRGGQEVRQALDATRRAVVLGDPGSGKSTVGLAYALWHSRSGMPVVFVRATDIADRLADAERPSAGETAGLLVGAFRRQVPTHADPEAQAPADDALVQAVLSDPSSVIVIDGLDEVTGSEKSSHIRYLIESLDPIPGRIVLTSRYIGYDHLGDVWQEFVVDRLSSEGASRFLLWWFGSQESEGFVRAATALNATNGIGLAEIPVLLGLVAYVAQDSTVPTNIAALYRHYVVHFIEGQWKTPRPTKNPKRADNLLQLLPGIAWAMATNKGRVEAGSWSDVTTLQELYKVVGDEHAVEVEALVQSNGILCAADVSIGALRCPLRWIHRSVQEHLCGEYLEKLAGDDRRQFHDLLVTCAQNPSVWAMSLAHMFGLLDERVRREVVDSFLAMTRVGDPGDAIKQSLQMIANWNALPPELKTDVAGVALGVRDWNLALAANPDAAKRELLELIRIRDPGVPNALGVFAHCPAVCRDVTFICDVLALYSGYRDDDIDMRPLMALMSNSVLRREAATAAIGIAVDAKSIDILRLCEFFFAQTHPDITLENIDAVLSLCHDADDQYAVVRCLQNWGVTQELIESSTLFLPEIVKISRLRAGLDLPLWQYDESHLENVRDEYMSILQIHEPVDGLRLEEQVGGGMAARMGYYIPRRLYNNASMSPWLELGIWTALLTFNEDFEDLDSLALVYSLACSGQPLDGDTVSATWADLSAGWERDVAVLNEVSRSVAHVLLHPEDTPSAAVVVHFAATICSRSESYELPMRLLDAMFLLDPLVAILERCDVRELRAAVLDSDPEIWRKRHLFIGFSLVLGIDDIGEEWALTEFLPWAARHQLDVLPEFAPPANIWDVLERILEDPSQYLSHTERDIGGIAYRWLEPAGLLPQWRQQLLALLPVGET